MSDLSPKRLSDMEAASIASWIMSRRDCWVDDSVKSEASGIFTGSIHHGESKIRFILDFSESSGAVRGFAILTIQSGVESGPKKTAYGTVGPLHQSPVLDLRAACEGIILDRELAARNAFVADILGDRNHFGLGEE